ncbi:conserved hypothetical protein [Leishmania mexicana MHOM/GT/2001/U1103]|uniref:Uncharacterized protein n=1 Tax=Leishmania mexicana (strain MHOM/GT/2001/U1103) TaxID=929439 RepID=E9AME1_LEIMU|nr:conserved hypothetical protein [Leishmania mexicana MHOM/GT/2001/U1103]CBZ24096.1 conserved hypothetical protein [Leishmania mexicana MHOM/GT/2001/U1103]
MGILPSRESHEYPGAFHFALSGSHAMAILPLTEHFFPSVDSLAFRQLYAGRDMQSAKYNFSLISPQLLRKYRHRTMEQRHGKGGVGDEAMAPPAGRCKPKPYLRHGQPPGDDSDADEKWVGVDTIDASNYGQFFKDDTQCVSPNDPPSLSLDCDEDVCEELQWPNPVAHWRTHDPAKQPIQDRENELGFTDELNYVSLDGKGGGLRCLPSSLSLPCSSSQRPRYGQAHTASTQAGTDSTAATAHFTAEERDLVNRFFARSPEALYNALVVEPNKGFLVDTNKEMCRLYAAEQRWKEARNVVRAYRRQCKQDAAAGDAAQPAAGESPSPSKAQPQRRVTEEEAEKAATVSPPPVFLRPVPQVIMVRMSREEEEATRATYLAEQQRLRSCSGQPQQSQSGGGDDAAASMSSSTAAAGAAEEINILRPPLIKPVSHLHVPATRYHRFEDDPKYRDGRIHLVEEDGVLYMFAYNTAYVDPRLRMRQQREELLKQQHQGKERKQQESQEESLVRGEASRSPSSVGAAVAGTAAEAAASGTTASSPGSCSTERDAAATPMMGSGSGDGDGAQCHANRQTSSFYHTVSAFGNEEDEAGLEEHGTQSKKAKDASPRRASSTEGSPVEAGTTPAVAATRTENTAEEEDEEEDTTLSSARSGPGGCQRRQSTILADHNPLLQRSDGKPSTSSDDEDEDDGDEQRKGAAASACSADMTATTPTGATSAAMKERRARVVQQLELVTAAPFILPICPVRIVGCNGYAESSCRGTPWLRGYEDEPEEDAYVESLPVKPPIMSGGGFIDANIGDKILSRAYLLGFQVYRNVCLDAGLPKTLTRPFWTLGLLSNIPLLQISREMRFRMRAAAAEVELGYRGLRDMIKGTENDLQSYIYGFSDILPYLQRVSRARVELAEAEAKAAAAAEGGDGAASLSLLPVGNGASETPGEEAQENQSQLVPPAIPTRSSQAAVQHNLLFPLNEMEFYTQFTIRGNQSLSRVRCEAQESFFHLIAEATAPVSTSLFMKPLELSTYDYGGAIRLHLLCNRVTGADELQVLPPPRNLDQLLSDHRRRLQLRRQPPTSADGNAAAAAPPYLVYAVVHPSGKARGPSLEHYKRNLQAPEDGGDANTLDEAEAAAAATDGIGGDGKYAAHQYTYPPGSFVESDMVIYNVHKGRWEHFEYFHHQQLAQRRARELQAQAEKVTGEPDGGKPPAQSNNDTTDAAAAKQAAESGEACRGALVPTSGGGFKANDDDDAQDIHLEDILLCWIKRRLQSATMRNRTDPGWLRDSEGHIVQEGRYYIWGFEQDGQQYFYGLIPKFAKEKKNKRHSAAGGNAHNQHNQDSHTRRITAHGNVCGSSSALNSHSRPQICGGSSSAPDRHGTLPETLTPTAQHGLVSGSINGRPADGRGGGRMENMAVRSGPASAGESSKKHSSIAPAPTAVAPSVSSSDVKGGVGGRLDARADAPLNTACPDSHSRRQHQQQQHPRSPGAVGGGVGRGAASSGGAAASANTAGANRSSNPGNATSGARLPAQTSGAPRTGASEKSSPPTSSSPAAASASSSTSSPVETSGAPPAFSYDTPGFANRRAAGSRGAVSPPPSAPAALVAPKESEAALAGRSGVAAVGRGGPSRTGTFLAQSPPSSVIAGGAASEAAASSSNPRTLSQRQDGVSRISSRGNVSREQNFRNSATTTAQFSRQSATAPAAASYTSAEEVGHRQGRGERRGNGAESAYASLQSQQRPQQREPRSANTSPPPPPPPAARPYPPHIQQHPEVHSARYPSSGGSSLASSNPVSQQQQQQQQQGCRISDPGAVALGYKGAPQNRYHAPQHQHEYMQAPSSAAHDHSSNNTNYSGGSGANRYAATSHTSGHSYSDVPPPPPQSPPPPPPLLPASAENAAYEQPHQGYSAPVEQQHHQQQQPSESPPPPLHLHPPTVYMNTGAGQASLRPTLVLAGSRVPSPRHVQQQQQYASYNARPHQPQQHVSHQPSYKTQPAMANVVSGARVQQPEMAPGPCHHHTQQMMMPMSAPNAGPAAPPPPPVQANAAMNTSSSRYAPHLRMVASGAGATPMQEQQQLASVTTVSAASPSALAGVNSMYSDVSAATVAPSGSRPTSYYPTTPSQVSYSTSSQAATSAIHPTGPQSNAVPPHTASGPPVLPQLKQQQQQQQQSTYPLSAMLDANTASGQGSVTNQCYLQRKKPQSPPSGPTSATPGGARYGQMASPTSQQHTYQQQMGTRNASYDGGSSGHTYGSYAASTANPSANSSVNRAGLSLSASAATVKGVTGASGTSILMGNASMSLPSTGSGIGRGAQGYAPQPSGYPASGSTSFTAAPVVAAATGATAPTSSMVPGAEGGAVKAFPPYQASPHPQQQHQQPSPQQQQQQQQQASVGGRAAGAHSPAPHQYRATPTAEQQQRDSRYPLQVMAQSYSNDYNGNGGVPAMAAGGRASRGVAVASDGLDSSSYDDAVLHGSRGAQAAAGEYQLSYQQQQYQQPYSQWQQQQHSTSASSQPSSCAPTPLPVQQQYAAQAGNGSDNNDGRGHTHTQASRAGATGNVNAPSSYAHEQRTSPYPQHVGAPPASPAAAGGGGSDRGAAAAVTAPAAVANLSTPMQSASSFNSNVATRTSPGSCESAQASSAAAQQQQRSSDSYGYRSSRSGPTSPYLQASPQQQQRSSTRDTASAGPFHRGAGGGLQPKAMMSAGGAPSASVNHAYPLHQPHQQQQGRTHSFPAPGGYYQHQALAHPQQQQQPSVASQWLTATPNASGTLLRASPGSQQRYNQQYQRQQQQQQQKPASPYISTKDAAEGQMRMSGNYSSLNVHSGNVGVTETPYDSNNNTAVAQRFAHNPYAMQ